MVRRIGSFVAMLLIATLVLAACGSEDDEVEPTVTRVDAAGAPEPTVPGQETPTAQPASGGEAAQNEGGATGGEASVGAVTIDVELVDIAFEPTEITVPANADVTVNLVNSGVGSHTFTVEALGVDSGEIPGGQSGTVTFNSGAPAEYEFICTVPGHKEAGMVGKLIVSAEAGTDGATNASPVAAGASPVAQPPAESGASAAPSTIDVEMVDIAFEPTEIRVPANTEITVNLTNSGVGSHTFTIDDLGVDSGQYAGGQSGTLTFNSGAPGSYEFVCTVPGHKEAGMVGTLIVE